MIISASSHPLAYWYATRATGVVALVLLTLSIVLGIADVERLQSERWPRFIVDGVHRRVSMLSVVFVLVHIATTVLDGYVPIGWLDAVIPFRSPYRTLWVGFGAVAFDLLLAVIVTSLLRARLGYRSWRAVHWLAYACWPIAVAHSLGTGTDHWRTWNLVIDGACLIAVLSAAAVRLSSGPLEAPA
jgi:sulfoxide reductase heme-binding subunit YedZ